MIKEISDYSMFEAEKVKKEVALAGGDVRFVFIPDLHYKYIDEMRTTLSDIIRSVNLINSGCPLDFVLFCGDNVGNYPAEPEAHINMMRELSDFASHLDIPWLCAQGNHDDNSIHGRLSERESRSRTGTEIPDGTQYDILFSHQAEYEHYTPGGEKSLYGYYDIPEKNTRIIILNGDEVPHIIDGDMLRYTGQWDYGYSGKQLDFFTHALDFDGDIILTEHIPFPEAFENDGIPHNGDILQDIIKTYTSREKYCRDFQNGDFPFSVSADFRDRKGRIIAEICGHNHMDNSLYNSLGILNISSVLAGRGNGALPNGTPVPKTPYSREETSIDFFCVNKKDNKLTAVRYGSGNSREFKI